MANFAITNNITANTQNATSNSVKLLTANKYVTDDIVVTNNVTVQSGSLTNSGTSGVTYAENTDNKTIIPSGGALYINEGWIPNTKITLGHLIPDDGDYKNAGVAHIRYGYEAYNTDGTKMIGTLPDVTPTFTGGGLTATPSVSVTGASATISASGKFADLTSTTNSGKVYGVTQTVPSGTDGVNFLKIDGYFSATSNGSATPTAKAERTAVTYNGNYTGYVDIATGTVASAAPSAVTTTASNATSVTLTATDNFPALYIPIVTASFDGGGVTATVNGSEVTNPVVTYSASAAGKDGNGAAVTLSNYGVSSGSTPNNNYIVITASGSATSTGSVKATADAAREKVTYTNAAGAIAAHNKSQALAAADATQSTKSITTNATATGGTITAYKIPIVSASFGGGSVTATVGGSEKTAVTITRSTSATISDSSAISTYGVTSIQPTGTGVKYVKISSSASQTAAGSVTATADANRTAVTYTNGAGAIAAHDGTQAIAAANATQDTTSITTSAQYSGDLTTYYLPVVTASFDGGGVTATAGGSQSTAPKVDAKMNGTATQTTTRFSCGYTPTELGISQTAGITEGKDYITFRSYGAAGAQGSVTATADAAREKVTYTNAAGAIAAHNKSQALDAADATQATASITTTASPNGEVNWYVKIGSVTPSVSTHTTSNASASSSITIETSTTTITTTGFSTTEPSSGGYIILTPSLSTGTGSASAKAAYSSYQGLIPSVRKSSESGVDTKTVNVTATQGDAYYVPVYDGAYTIS